MIDRSRRAPKAEALTPVDVEAAPGAGYDS
jgi:hypothetical protein